MLKFGFDFSFYWVLLATSLFAIFCGARMLFLSKNLEREAQNDWAYQVSEDMQDLRLTEGAYVRAYKKINAPRGWKFLSMAFAAVTIMSIPAFSLIQLLLYKVWRDNLNEVSKMPQFQGRMSVLSDPVLVWQFSIFFTVIGFLVLLVGLFVRQYYKGAPGLMRDAVLYERAGFIPGTALTVGPNPAHFKANNDTISRKLYREMFEVALGLSRQVVKNWQDSGHNCDVYSNGSDMQIYVHSKSDEVGFSPTTHPFFFAGKFARLDDKPELYTIIVLMPDAYGAFKKIQATGIKMADISATPTSRYCSFKCENMEVFIYDETISLQV